MTTFLPKCSELLIITIKKRKNWEFEVVRVYAYLHEHSDVSQIYSKLT